MKVIRHGTPRWSDPGALHGQKLRRWTSHRPALKNVLELAVDHAAVVEGRTIFPSRVFNPADVGRVLISGENSRKIGGSVTKGLWKGLRIFTLSLEERASCPRSCTHWRTCYLNHMPFTKRLRHGPALVARIEQELIELTERHPEGVVIRAHISGDFWSTSYVRQWARWLRRIQHSSCLRVYRPSTAISHRSGDQSRHGPVLVKICNTVLQLKPQEAGREHHKLSTASSGCPRGDRLPRTDRKNRNLRNLRPLLGLRKEHCVYCPLEARPSVHVSSRGRRGPTFYSPQASANSFLWNAGSSAGSSSSRWFTAIMRIVLWSVDHDEMRKQQLLV